MRIANAICAGTLICLAAAAGATTLARMSVGQMTQAAALVARVRCDGSEAVTTNGEIWTVTRFEVLEAWKGHAPRRIEVRLPGGHAGHLISLVPGVPRFFPGEEAVLFLEPARAGGYSVTAWGEGSFRIRKAASDGAEWAAQDSGGLILRQGGRGAEAGSGGRRRLADLRAEVTAAEREAKR